MLIQRPPDIHSSEITDETVYLGRRRFLQTASLAALAGAANHAAPVALASQGEPQAASSEEEPASGPYDTAEAPTPYEAVTTYNNFYEFGSDKASPAELAHRMTVEPWTVSVEGLVKKPTKLALEDLLKPHPLEDRIYRLRCVEGWSMVISWLGFPLSDLIKRLDPLPRARYVEFTTLHRPEEMPGQRRSVLKWPYVEGLRMDEAINPLAILAVGLYGRALPNQNGAPLRLVVPWKYGFKSIKSIVRIRFVEKQPLIAWARAVPKEYGFYSNVNPTVDHPRWSQKTERRIGEFFKRPTLMFNGYGEHVAHMYAGMDLRKYF